MDVPLVAHDSNVLVREEHSLSVSRCAGEEGSCCRRGRAENRAVAAAGGGGIYFRLVWLSPLTVSKDHLVELVFDSSQSVPTSGGVEVEVHPGPFHADELGQRFTLQDCTALHNCPKTCASGVLAKPLRTAKKQ